MGEEKEPELLLRSEAARFLPFFRFFVLRRSRLPDIFMMIPPVPPS